MNKPETGWGGELTTEERLQKLEAFISKFALGATIDVVPMWVFEGGRKPVRQTEGAIGYDAYARAIVDEYSKPTDGHALRRTRADFMKTEGWRERIDEPLRDFVADDPTLPDKYAIVLPPKERCMVGLGFATAMQYPMFYWVAPRSGFAARGITLGNSPGTVDPDYRGEAGALVFNNSREPFAITHDMRIAQIIFQIAVMPEFEIAADLQELPESRRGAGGFGSTGAHG